MTDNVLRAPHDAEQFRMKVGRFGDRHYYDPLPADEVWPADHESAPYPSVSTIKKATSRDFSQVSARRVAEYAVRQRSTWQAVAEDNEDAAITLLIGADQRGLRQAGERGTAVHGVMENLAAGRSGLLNIDASAIPYLEGCKAFLHDNKPTFLYNEVVAISRKLKYGGTLDCILAIGGKHYLVDWKSRKAGGHDAYIEEAWQVAAYANADYYIVGDEHGQPMRVPVPHLDGGLIVSLCPNEDSYRIYPVDLDKAQVGWVQLRRMWEAKMMPEHKPLGKPIELCPRTYTLNLPPKSAAAEEKPAWDPFEGLPTGDVAGTTHPLEQAAPEAFIPAINPAAYDKFISTEPIPKPGEWVLATFYGPTLLDGNGRVIAPSVEQRVEGWLVELHEHRVVVTDDAGNPTTIDTTATEAAINVVHAKHPAPPGVLRIPGGQQLDEGLVEPTEVDTHPPAVVAPPDTSGQDEGDPEIRAWLRRRLAFDIEHMGGQTALLRYWPAGIKPLDEAGRNKHTVAMLEQVEQALTNFERDLSIPFGETKPGLEPEPEPEEPDNSWQYAEAGISLERAEADEAGPKPAHPDDVQTLLARCMETAEAYPQTWKVIETLAKDAGIPNLKRDPTADHLLMLDSIITEQVMALKNRIFVIESLMEGVSDDMKVMIPFALGPVSGSEPTGDDVKAIELLTSAAIMGKLEISDQAELVASADLMEEARKVFPERVQLFRAVNPFLTKAGFSTVNSLESLRRRPLGIVCMLDSEAHKNQNN